MMPDGSGGARIQTRPVLIHSPSTRPPTHHLPKKKCAFQNCRSPKENGIVFTCLCFRLLRARFDVILWLKKVSMFPIPTWKLHVFHVKCPP